MVEPVAFVGHVRRFSRRHGRWLWVVGAMVYLCVLWYIGWDGFIAALGAIAWPWLGAMMAVEVGVVWGRAWKWRYGIGPGRDAVRLYFMAKAGGNLTPGRVGELSPLLLARHRSPRTAAWIILDRLLEIAATLVVGAIGAVVLGIALADSLQLQPWMIALGWTAALAGMVLVPLLLVTRHRALGAIAARLPDGSRAQRIGVWIAEVSREACQFGVKAPALAVLTFAATAADLVIGMLLYGSFGFWLPLALLAAAQCVHALVSVIPITPNATGVPYLAAAVLLHEVAGVPPEVLALAVPVRMALAGAVFWLSFAVAMGRRGERDASVGV